MKILFVREPHIDETPSGPRVVAQKLLEYLYNKVNVVLYPRVTYVHSLSRLRDIINRLSLSYRAVMVSDIDLVHYITIPIITDFAAESIILLSKLRRIPIVVNIHGIVYKENPITHEYNVLRNKLVLISHIRAYSMNRIVVNSRYMKVVASSYYNLPENKVVVIPNGVDIRRFTPSGGKINLDGDPAILFAGRISWEKGVDVLIKALKLLKQDLREARVHVVGSGPWIDDVIQLAKKLNVNSHIKFHGKVPYHSLPYIFRGADIFILPSRVEPFGMVLLEAMGCGLPIVASKVGGIPEIVNHYENGILITPENSVELSKAIVEIYSDSTLRKKLSANALLTALKYSWESVANMYLKLYEQLILR
ncbi:MAG: glycosyltransferase family 4 protein [Thermosphaera sp.]